MKTSVQSARLTDWKAITDADSVGYEVCLAKRHGSETTTCAKTFVTYASTEGLLVAILVASESETVLSFHWKHIQIPSNIHQMLLLYPLCPYSLP
jgi:hypothetical protein